VALRRVEAFCGCWDLYGCALEKYSLCFEETASFLFNGMHTPDEVRGMAGSGAIAYGAKFKLDDAVPWLSLMWFRIA